jgi:integrase
MADGPLYKRCGCRHPDTDKPLNNTCPKLRRRGGTWSSDHGQWAYQIELGKDAQGSRMRLRRGGFDDRDSAVHDRAHASALLELAGNDDTRRIQIAALLLAAARSHQRFPDIDAVRRRLGLNVAVDRASITVGDYLTQWVANLDIDDNTIRGYESHIRVHIIPHLGDIRLEDLRVHHIKTMFAHIRGRHTEVLKARNSNDPNVRATVKGIRTAGPSTCQRIRASLRKALNDAIADELITTNPAVYVKTPGRRARPQLWTEERVARWRDTGKKPGPVMVWTDDQVIEFLEFAEIKAPDLHPMFHLIAYRAPRRGEVCGLLACEVGPGKLSIVNQIATHGNTPVSKPPKSETGNREVFLDDDTEAVLNAYRRHKAAQRLAAGPAWPDTGLFFTQADGTPYHPNSVTQRFRRLVSRSALPPIRLHDLRHSAASIHLAAGADVKVVQELLGHTTSTLTRDTYQSVLPELHQKAGNDVAARLAGKRDQRRRRAA